MRPEVQYELLKERVQAVEEEVRKLQERNSALRVRLAALQLEWRCLREARAHRAARGMPCDHDNEQLARLEQQLAGALEAVGGSFPSMLDGLPHLAPGTSVLLLEG